MRYLLLLLAACTTEIGGVPSTCGLGDAPDEGAFEAIFESMELRLADGDDLPQGADGVLLSPTDDLQLQLETPSATIVRVCVENARAGGTVVLDVDVDVQAGVTEARLDAFSVGTYVMRIAVADTLVRSYPFEVAE